MRVVTPACLLLLGEGCLVLAFGFELSVANRSAWGGSGTARGGGRAGTRGCCPRVRSSRCKGPWDGHEEGQGVSGEKRQKQKGKM